MSDNNSTQQQPETAPPLITSSERVRNYLVWGFAISIALHLLGGPFLNNMRFAKGDEKEKVTKVTVSVVVTPKPSPPPTPKPTPPATPPPHATPPPNSTPPPHLKLQPPKTTSQNKSSSSETAYNKPGGAADVGQGNVGTGNQSAAPAATAAPPAPTPVPAPTKPQCANPNQDAVATQKAVPDYPDMARQQGLSGVSQIKVTLDERGKVVDTSVYKSSSPLLDRAAMQAARMSSYSPEKRDCLPVGGSYIFTAEFSSQ